MDKTFFDQPVKNDLRTYDNTWKIVTGQGDDYTNGCLLDYIYFKNYFKMIALDISKQQELDADSTAINLNQRGNTTMLPIIQEVKETMLDFSQGTVKVF